MNKIAFASIVIIATVGLGGYYYTNWQADQTFKNTVNFIAKELPGSSLTYDTYHVNFFSKNVTLTKVSFKDVDRHVYTADKLVMPLSLNNPLGHLEADNIHFKIKDGSVVDIGHSEVDNFKYSDGFNRKTNQYLKNFDAKRVKGKNYFKIANVKINELALGKILANIQEGSSKPFSFIQDIPHLFRINGVSAFWNFEPWKVEKIESRLKVDNNGDAELTGEISAEQLPLYRFFSFSAIGYGLQALPYDLVDLTANIQANYKKENDDWSIQPFIVKIKGLGDLTINAKFKQPASIDWSEFKEDPLSPMLHEYNYVSLSAILRNQGIVRRIIQIESKENRGSEADVKQDMLSNLQMEIIEAEYPFKEMRTKH